MASEYEMMIAECFGINVASPRGGCLQGDSFREQAYANLYDERAIDSFVELEIYSDPMRDDMYAFHNLVANPLSMDVDLANASRIVAYATSPVVAEYETMPQINSYRAAIYATAPESLRGNISASINSTRADVYAAYADLDGPDGFESVRDQTREIVYAALPSFYAHMGPAHPHPLRGAVYNSLPSTPSALTPPSTPPAHRLSRKQTYAMYNAERASTSASSHLSHVSAAESSLTRSAVYSTQPIPETIADVQVPLSFPTLTNNNNNNSRSRSSTYVARELAMAAVLPTPTPMAALTRSPTRVRGASTSAKNALSNSNVAPSSAPLPRKTRTLSSMSVDALPNFQAYGTSTRTPTIMRTGSSKNLFALGATSSLLGMIADEASGSGGAVVEPAIVQTPPPRVVKLTRVGHLGTIAQLEKFAA